MALKSVDDVDGNGFDDTDNECFDELSSKSMSDDECFDELSSKSMSDDECFDELSSIEIAYLAKNFRNFLRNKNRKARDKNNVEPRNFKKNKPIKLNNADKSKEKVGQTSNSLDQQCFGCQGYGHVKSEYPTFLRSKGKAMTVTLSDDESDHESGSDEDRNFIAFIATAVVDESVVIKENPSDEELSKCADL